MAEPHSFPSSALAAGIALVVAAWAAVGVADDLLVRAVRNEPTKMAWALILPLAAIGVASALYLWKTSRVIAVAIPALLVAVGVAILVGAGTVSGRERPFLVLNLSESDGATTITIEAGASSLRLNEGMLVRVLGLRTFPELEADAAAICESSSLDQLSPNNGDLLLWQRSGPTGSGDAAISVSFTVTSPTYEAVCAYAVLRNREGIDVADSNAAAYLRLVEAPDTES